MPDRNTVKDWKETRFRERYGDGFKARFCVPTAPQPTGMLLGQGRVCLSTFVGRTLVFLLVGRRRRGIFFQLVGLQVGIGRGRFGGRFLLKLFCG